MIIAVSDTHFGYNDTAGKFTKQEQFLDFLDKCDSTRIDHFVLLGDIFDFWVRGNAKVFTTLLDDNEIRQVVSNNEKIFSRLCSLKAKNVHYIVGNHDYLVYHLNSRAEVYPFTVTKNLRLSEGGRDYFFTHGYDLDVFATMELFKMSVDNYEKSCYALSFMDDPEGFLAVNGWGLGEKIGQFWDALRNMTSDRKCRQNNIRATEKLANSRAAALFLGMKPAENLVYGHTHRPYYASCDGFEVANTGAWEGKDVMDARNVNTYVKIENGKMSVQEYRGGDTI